MERTTRRHVAGRPSPAMDGREFEFTQADFEFVREFLRQRAGIALGDQKKSMAYSRLARRLRALGLSRFSEYRSGLEAGDEREVAACVNALTTNLTMFFREEHHFTHLRDEMLARKEKDRSRRLRIWSAGCSTGEEPYSIAIVLESWLRGKTGWDAKILATDLDTNVLEKGKAGVYSEKAVAPAAKWTKTAFHPAGPSMRTGPHLRRLITFKQLNLLKPWPMSGPFDAIFCRNVMIYFDKDTQRRLVERFHAILDENAFLYLGHSESLHHISGLFEPIGRTAYRRR